MKEKKTTNILFVGNMSKNIMDLKNLFHKQDVNIITTTSLNDVLSLVKKNEFAMVILDSKVLTGNEQKKIKTNLIQEMRSPKYIEDEIMYRERLESVIEMAVSVCHELTQPLQIIAGYSDLILMNTDDPRNLHQRIHKIKEQVSRVTALTQQLIGIIRYKTKASHGKTKPVNFDMVNERRRHKRYIPKSGTILIPYFNTSIQGQVIDISRDGLAFWSDEPDVVMPPDITRVSLSIPEEKIMLDNLPCRFLDKHAKSHVMILNDNRMKRHSIRFEQLTHDKLDQLEQFILNHTSAKTE